MNDTQIKALKVWIDACNDCSSTITKAEEKRCLKAIHSLAMAFRVKATDIEAMQDSKYVVFGAYIKGKRFEMPRVMPKMVRTSHADIGKLVTVNWLDADPEQAVLIGHEGKRPIVWYFNRSKTPRHRGKAIKELDSPEQISEVGKRVV